MIHIDVRKKWIDNSSDYSSKEEIISDVKENFDIRRYYSAEGKSVIIDNITTQVIIQSHLNPLNEGKYDKKIHMPIETVVNTGSIVEWENDKWIIVSNIDNLQAYKTASMIKSNNTLQFYDSTSTIHTIPCIISKGLISLDEQKIISTLDSEIAIQISNTDITRQIPMNYVFKIGLRNYSVVNIDDIIIPGLLIIKMVYSEVEQVFPSYSLTILNGDSIQADINTPVQLNIQVKDRETIITSPLFTFTSSNNLIATVTNTGLVSFLSVGNVNINCKLDNDNLIQDSIGIEIVEEEQHNYTAEISGSISIIKTYSSTYACTFKDNGIAIEDNSVFYLTGDDGVSETLLASIVSQDSVGNNCVVKGLNLGYVRLFVKNVGETVVSGGFRIQIKSLF